MPSVLEKELKKIVGEDAKLVLDVGDRSENKSYLLQRYSSQWMDYVDVISPIEIATGDKVRAVPLAPRKVVASNSVVPSESEVR